MSFPFSKENITGYQIPYLLIGELATKMTPKEWIDVYEKVLNTAKKK